MNPVTALTFFGRRRFSLVVTILGGLFLISRASFAVFGEPGQVSSCIAIFAEGLNGTQVEADGIGFVFDEWHRLLEQNKPIPNAQAFVHFANQFNSDECECRLGLPGLASKTLSRINRLARGLVGAASDPAVILKQGLSVEFARTGNDPDAVRSLIKRERTAFIDAFQASVAADVAYMQGFLSVFRRIQESKKAFPQNGSEVVSEIKRAIDLSAQIRRLKIQINEHESRSIGAEDVQKKKASLLELLEAESQLRRDLRLTTRRLADMRSNTSFLYQMATSEPPTPLTKIEIFLLSEWAKLDELKRNSQMAMSKLYVTQERIQILDGILAGDLNQLEGPVDSHALDALVITLQQNEDYLLDPKIFGSESASIAKIADRNISLYQRYSHVRHLSDRWLDVWHGRLTLLKPWLEFTYTNQVLLSELRRFLTNNNPRGQGANLRDALTTVIHTFRPKWNSPRYDPNILPDLIPRDDQETVADEESRSISRRPDRIYTSEVTPVVQAIKDLAQIIRKHESSRNINDDAELATYNDALGTVHSYLVIVADQKQPLDRQIVRAMASSDAMVIFNWMSELATVQSADGPGYSLLLAEKILEVQIAPLKRYQRLAPAITENIMVWVGAWYGVIPGLQHSYEFLKHWFGW